MFTEQDVWLVFNPKPGGPGLYIYVPRDRVAHLYPLAPGSIFVASYDSQGYSGGILTRLHNASTD
jgi:hypothetical protein